MPDDPIILAARLDRARRRLADAPAYSPDWDATMALIEDLERRLADVGDQRELVLDETSGTVPIPI